MSQSCQNRHAGHQNAIAVIFSGTLTCQLLAPDHHMASKLTTA